ncbi:FxSxx-COOH system tetratricopeptide repeat protein [Amycolatopsis sp. CA-128772]|uniref:FxSxx-COOH system tetratricopeptide repeat protein n=1 Tax=Amycolatopsis sp. CA-128772 TaxID=2073159 RepID=UPI000CD079FC|nr:FxSxx-COOH system tetratricopeptide repeat protein [Amycolatopsis sp. CA-128772]
MAAGVPGGVPDAHDLTWREVADALWLTSAIQGIGPGRAGESSPPAASESEPDRREPANRPPAPPDRAVDDPSSADDPRRPEPAGDAAREDPPEAGPRGRRPGRAPEFSPPPGVPQPVEPLAVKVRTKTPTARAVLSDSAAFARALQPFKRKVRSRRPRDVELSEGRTAEHAAETGNWLPVLVPSQVRWLNLTVVLDSAPSMSLWRSQVSAFVALLKRRGGFRSVQVRLLDTAKSGYAEDGTVIAPVLRGGTPDAPARGPGELLDPSGERVMLVVTDGVGDAWRRDLVSPLLSVWAKAMPVAVVHLLPQRLWSRGGLDVHRVVVSAGGPVAANAKLGVRLQDAWLDPEGALELLAGTTVVPVLEFSPRWLSWWADLTARGTGGERIAKALLVGDRPNAADREPVVSRREFASAEEQVRVFHADASPQAYQLAVLLAAVPVTVGTARTLQAELVAGAELSHLTEVFGSGLLERVDDDTEWNAATWEFGPRVRQILLRGARRSETASAVITASREHAREGGALARLRDAVLDPDATPDPDLATAAEHEVDLERVVMRALSGPYLSRADRLRSAESADRVRVKGTEGTESTVGSRPEENRVPATERPLPASIRLVSETMSQASDRTGPSSESIAPVRPVSSAPDGHSTIDVSPAIRSGVLSNISAGKRHERLSGDQAPPVWGSVPPKNPNFTGRRELLDQLGERLGAGTTAVLPAALHGMGGIGKTQMAVEYIYRHLADYDIVWWIQATEATQIRTSLTELAQHLKLPGCDEAITAIPAVREALRVGKPYARWLLVFDSAESPEVVRPFFPVNGPGEILVTSRNPDWAGIARPLEVAVFEREESRELLRMRGPEITDEEADLLSEKLGDLPLAIAQAAAWRAETGMPVNEYIRLFDEKVAEILDTSAPTDYEVSVAAAWNVSFDELKKRNLSAHQLLQVCAFFAPEPITRSFFTGVRSISVAPELDTALRDPMKLGRAVRDVNRFGLAKIDHRNDTLVLHRLVQLVLRERMNSQDRANLRHGAHVLLANLDPNDPISPKQWPRYQEILPHVYSAEVIDCDDSWVRQLVLNLLAFLYQWGDHQAALELAERTVENWTRKHGEKDPQTLEALDKLGFYHWVLGHYRDAAEINERALKLCREVYGADAEQTLNVEMSVAVDLKAKGDFTAARDLNWETFAKAKALFGEDDPITLGTAHDYVVSALLAGEYQAAAEHAEQTYLRRVEVLGYDSPATIGTQVLLVISRRELGDYPWARIEGDRIAERARELFGEDSVGTLRRKHFQSVGCRKDGDHDTALRLSQEALERFRIRYGERHPNAMACALGHSIDLRHAKDLSAARKLGEQVFDLYRTSLGEEHPHTLGAALDLGVTLRLNGDPASALDLDERSLEKLGSQLGVDHPHTIVCAIDVASDKYALGRTVEALVMDTESLDRSRRVLGENHPTTLAVQLNRALDLRELGHEQEAETLHADVLTRYRHALGDNHPATIAAARGIRADCDIDPSPL